MTKVSVIIAAKDAAPLIGHAVRSALAQQETREVIVVDDGSIDGTAEAARAAGEPLGGANDRLVMIRLATNQGPSFARNRALDVARGEFVAVLDADDWLLPDRFARLFAGAGAGWDFAADDLLMLHPGQDPAAARPMIGIEGPARPLGLLEFVESNLPGGRQRRELGYLKPVMRREFLEAHRLRYEGAVRLGEDFILYAAALARGARMQLLPACGYIALQRPGSLSRLHGAAELGALAEASRQLLRLPDLPPGVVAALRRHRRLTLDKHFHRVALDAKARGDWRAVARAFLGTPSAARHILGETLAARLRRG